MVQDTKYGMPSLDSLMAAYREGLSRGYSNSNDLENPYTNLWQQEAYAQGYSTGQNLISSYRR